MLMTRNALSEEKKLNQVIYFKPELSLYDESMSL